MERTLRLAKNKTPSTVWSRVSWLCSVGWGNLRSHWFWGEQEWQRNLKQNHCLAGSGSDPSSVIVQENSWSVAWTNASLLNISLWLTELPFSQDWDIVAKKGLAQRRIYSVNFYYSDMRERRLADTLMWSFNSVGAVFIFSSFSRCSISSRFWMDECKQENVLTSQSKTSQLSHFSVYCFSLMQIK